MVAFWLIVIAITFLCFMFVTLIRNAVKEEKRITATHVRYGWDTANKILASKVWLGMTKEMLIASKGEPATIYTRVSKTKTRVIFNYGSSFDGYRLRVFLENDLVVGWKEN